MHSCRTGHEREYLVDFPDNRVSREFVTLRELRCFQARETHDRLVEAYDLINPRWVYEIDDSDSENEAEYDKESAQIDAERE